MTMESSSSSSMSNYRPQSPDLSSYAPQSPDLSGVVPPAAPVQHTGYYSQSAAAAFPGYPAAPAYHLPPTHTPTVGYAIQHTHASFAHPPPDPYAMAGQHYHGHPDAGYLPDAPLTRSRRGQPLSDPSGPFNNHHAFNQPLHPSSLPPANVKTEVIDPTYGVQLKTSFPVARIKRIMQADEDIGKVAQVTPHVVSRALELFMIKLITASASQAQAGASGGAKAQKRIMAQHLKRVIMTNDSFDFLREIADKIPDVAAKGKKEATSDSDDAKPAKRKGKKRKDSGDDF